MKRNIQAHNIWMERSFSESNKNPAIMAIVGFTPDADIAVAITPDLDPTLVADTLEQAAKNLRRRIDSGEIQCTVNFEAEGNS